jgi:hypothetical protein
MKPDLLRLICAVVLLLAGLQNAVAQGYHQLTVDDFEGMPRSTSYGVIAYTNCTIDFRYEGTRQQDYYQLSFTIKVIFNHNKSWMDKSRITSSEMLAEILKHEQGHYTIAYMEQQELLRAVAKTVFYADYQRQAQSIFDRIDAKYKQLNIDYDADTQHMVNRGQQSSWDMYFQKRLAYMPPPDGN